MFPHSTLQNILTDLNSVAVCLILNACCCWIQVSQILFSFNRIWFCTTFWQHSLIVLSTTSSPTRFHRKYSHPSFVLFIFYLIYYNTLAMGCFYERICFMFRAIKYFLAIFTVGCHIKYSISIIYLLLSL